MSECLKNPTLPLKEALLTVGDEVEAGHGNGPSEGAAHQACR